MSIFDYEETLCNREGNQCKLRKKCLRYLRTQGEDDWIANYWQEHGSFCEEKGYFMPVKEKEVIDGHLSKAQEEAKEKKGDR